MNHPTPRLLLILLACAAHAADSADDKSPIQVKVDRNGTKTAKVTVDVTIPDPVDTRKEAEERSAVLVTRGIGKPAQAFGAVLAPKVAAQASESGVSTSPSEVGEQTETQQIVDARSRGANYLIEISVNSFSSSVSTILSQQSRRVTANVAWRVIDITANNAAVGSGQVNDSSVADTIIAEEEQVAALSDAVARKVGVGIVQKLNGTKGRQAAEWPVQFRIRADELTFPSIVVDENHVVRRSKEPINVELTGFTLTCDGVVVGTVPSVTPISLPRGLRTISLERSGFEPWKGKVNVREGLVIEPVIRPTEDSIARWRAQTAFLQGLADGAKLNDAQAEKVRGAAEALRNSGFKTNVNVKVEADELPETVLVAPGR